MNRKNLLALTSVVILLAFGWVTPSAVSAHSAGRPTVTTGTAARRPPRTYDVDHYIIRTRFDRAKRTVFGDVSVRLKPLGLPFNSFELDAGNLKIESVVLEPDDTPLDWKSTSTRLSIQLPRPAEEMFTVRIVYQAQPKRGLYFIPAIKGSPKVAQAAQIWTQGEAEDNRYWFPCYDFPDDKATVEQYITTTSPGEVAIANGVLINVANNADGTRTFHWSMDQVFSTYLVSIVIGEYSQIKDKVRDIAFEYNTYRGTEDIARRVFSRTPQMLRYFETRLNYPYPYRRYAQTIVASFVFGGMENITSTTHADTEILYAATGEGENGADDLIAHELSHSWFGNLVTCKDWSELWLNEGLATFMEASFAESVRGRAAYLAVLRADQREFLSEDNPSRRHPLVNRNYTTGSELFDATTYKKGGLVIHMLRETVGDEVFWRALNTYLNKFKYSNVTSQDLQTVFETASGQNLTWFFDQWVYQAGFPELSIEYSFDPVRKQLFVDVEQTQKAQSQTPAAFRLPLQIQINTSRGAQLVTAEITQREQSFIFDVPEDPRSIDFDPNFRLLKKLEAKRAAMRRAA